MQRNIHVDVPHATQFTIQRALLASLLAALGLVLLLGIARPTTPITYAATGGLDSHSYVISDEAACTTTFEDISTSGTALGLGDDEASNVTLPFNFTFYGVTSDTLRIGNNGGIIFADTSRDIDFENKPLPTSNFDLAILPFWDDLDDIAGNVYYETRGTAPNRRFIVQWHERPHFPGSETGGLATFQVVLYETSNTIDFVYQDVDFGDSRYDYGASATIGLQQNSTGSAQQYSYNTPSLNGISAICFSPPTLELNKTTDASLYSPGDTVTFTITARSNIATSISDGIINDTLPDGLAFVTGSITLDPPTGGTPGTAPPTLAEDLTLSEGDMVTVTLQAMVDNGVTPGQITNLATISSATAGESGSDETTIFVEDCAARVENELTIYDTVQAAIDAADPGETVKVAGYCASTQTRPSPLLYEGPETVTQIGLINKSLTLRGGYTPADWDTSDPQASPTTLDALRAGRGLLVSGEITVTLENLNITGGNAAGQGGIFSNDRGGGIMAFLSTITIKNNMVYANIAPAGGGITLYDTDATLYNSTIMSNTTDLFGAGINILEGKIFVDGNTIASNTALGGSSGGLDIQEVNGTLRNNTIIGNRSEGQGGALRVLYSNLDLINNVIADNSLFEADDLGAGIYIGQSIVNMPHNTIARNTGGDGSGILIAEELVRSARATADEKTSTRADSRFARVPGVDSPAISTAAVLPTVTMTNTILMNQTIGITVSQGFTATLDYTLWGAGEWANLTNIGGAGTVTSTNAIIGTPDFVDPASGDYHINENSDAINAGIYAGATIDIDGSRRPLGGGFDIGADEFGVVVDVVYVPFVAKLSEATP
jgi:uncharacterized repeat protein (TIGR01451 family)